MIAQFARYLLGQKSPNQYCSAINCVVVGEENLSGADSGAKRFAGVLFLT